MKTFKEFLDESSLSRIKSKSDKGGIATMSASRADKSAKENRARAKQLDRDIRGRGLGGATKVTGSYMEKDKKTGEDQNLLYHQYYIFATHLKLFSNLENVYLLIQL